MLPLAATLLLVGLRPTKFPLGIELDFHVAPVRQQLAADQFGEACRNLERVRVLRAKQAIEIAKESFFLCAQVPPFGRRQRFWPTIRTIVVGHHPLGNRGGLSANASSLHCANGL